MAAVPVSRDDAMAFGRTARNWVQWQQMLNEITPLLHDQIQKTGRRLKVTIKRKSSIATYSDRKRLYLWTQHIEAEKEKTKLYLTPHFVCDETHTTDPVRFALGVETDTNATLMRQIKSILAQSAKIEENDTTDRTWHLYFPCVPADLFAQGTLEAQAETLDAVAMDAIARSILDVASS